MAEGITEKDFEAHIENYLYQEEKYWVLSPKEYDKDLCLHAGALIAFIQESQPKVYKELCEQYGVTVNEKIVQNVAKNLQQRKTLDVLRNGIKDRGQKINLIYFKPANSKTPEHETWYEQNRLGVIRQLQYSRKNSKRIGFSVFRKRNPNFHSRIKKRINRSKSPQCHQTIHARPRSSRRTTFRV